LAAKFEEKVEEDDYLEESKHKDDSYEYEADGFEESTHKSKNLKGLLKPVDQEEDDKFFDNR
jgi:guanylate kinase